MKTGIVHDVDRCYLVVETEKEKAGYQQKMILSNQVEGLLAVEQRKVDTVCKYYYDITDKQSVQEYFTRSKVSVEDIKFVFTRVFQVIQDAKEFMLDSDSFVVNVEHIYMNLEGTALYICFCEDYHVDIKQQALKMVEYFMELIDYKDEVAVKLIYSIYKMLREESCSMGFIKETIKGAAIEDREANESIELVQKKSITQEQVYPIEQMKKTKISNTSEIVIAAGEMLLVMLLIMKRYFFYEYSNQINIKHILTAILILVVWNTGLLFVSRYFRNKKEVSEKILFEDSNLYDEEATVVISNSSIEFVLRGGRGEVLHLKTFPFLIGSNEAVVDGLIKCPEVSKRHAVINKKGSSYRITDLNSTNGTFLNGELIESMLEYDLMEDDKITFADVTYQFARML